MESKSKNKLIRLLCSFALFLGGVFALQMEPSVVRTWLLVAVFAGLIAIAVLLTISLTKKK